MQELHTIILMYFIGMVVPNSLGPCKYMTSWDRVQHGGRFRLALVRQRPSLSEGEEGEGEVERADL